MRSPIKEITKHLIHQLRNMESIISGKAKSFSKISSSQYIRQKCCAQIKTLRVNKRRILNFYIAWTIVTGVIHAHTKLMILINAC